jgi:hypothetical protein
MDYLLKFSGVLEHPVEIASRPRQFITVESALQRIIPEAFIGIEETIPKQHTNGQVGITFSSFS